MSQSSDKTQSLLNEQLDGDYALFDHEPHHFEQLLRLGSGHHIIDAQADPDNPAPLSVMLPGEYHQWQWSFQADDALYLKRHNSSDAALLMHVTRIHFSDQSVTCDWLKAQSQLPRSA